MSWCIASCVALSIALLIWCETRVDFPATTWSTDTLLCDPRAMTTTTVPAADAGPEVHEATPATTRESFTRSAGRGYTVIRNQLVQVRVGGKWTGSTVGRLVEARQPRALLAYLLLLMSWSAIDKREQPLEAGVWARALSPSDPQPEWPAAAMTRIWNVLEEFGLIHRSRQGRLVKLGPRREDGVKPYTRPRPDLSAGRREKFFILPDSFWLDGWHEKLSLPGLAVLLILLEETTGRDEVAIGYERAPDWYGVSAKTFQNGVEDLRKNSLVAIRKTWVRDDFSTIGKKPKFFYSLTGEFSRQSRRSLQAAATRATKKRIAKSARAAAPRPGKQGGPDGAQAGGSS